MTRKRVYPLIRASNGSAFTKCELCRVSLPIALADLHDCDEFTTKRRKITEDKCCGIPEKPNEKKSLLTIDKESMERPADYKDQPRSPFCFFMEEFIHNFEGQILIEVSQRGFEAWRSMSVEEQSEYSMIASKVNSSFEKKILEEEIDQVRKNVDDEAISSNRNACQCCELL